MLMVTYIEANVEQMRAPLKLKFKNKKTFRLKTAGFALVMTVKRCE